MNMPPALTRFAAFAKLGQADIRLLTSMASPLRELQRGENLFHEGDAFPGIFLLVEGWMSSSTSVAEGARQMLKIHMPGDAIGLPGLSVTQSPDTVTALTSAVVSKLPLASLGQIFEQSPRIAALLFLVSQEERVMLMDRLTAAGRIESVGRLSAVLLQIHDRILRYDATAGDTIVWPLTREDFADLVGISHIHANRIMASLRRSGLIAYNRNSLTILDREKLRDIAGLPKRSLNKDQRWLPAARA